MAKVIVLGSASAVADRQHDNTHFVILDGQRMILIDCAGNPVTRLAQLGMDACDLNDVILTHFHPDHVSGFPLLAMDLWLMGRKTPLNVYGLDYTLDRMKQMLDLYGWQTWPGMYPIHFHYLPEKEEVDLFASETMKVVGSAVKHFIPTIGLRFDFKDAKKSFAYSCDTEPCDAVVRLAKDVDVLFHESYAEGKGHSSPHQAGEIARKANAKTLFLIHYANRAFDEARILAEAQEAFGGITGVAHDFMTLTFEA